jgi:hypothetical protein
LLFRFVVETHRQFTLGVFLSQLLRDVSLIKPLHELLVFGFVVVIELALIDDEPIFIESDFANTGIFALLLLHIIFLTPEYPHNYLEFFSAFCMIPATSGLITAIPLLSPPV